MTALTVVAGCSGMKLFRDIGAESRSTAGVDYGAFKTFRFLHSERRIERGTDVKITPTPEPLDVYLEDLVTRGLGAHGLTAAEPKADLEVRLTVVARLAPTATDPEAEPVPDESILEVAITRTSDNREVWHGLAHGEVWEEADEATTKQRIEHAVSGLLARYPN